MKKVYILICFVLCHFVSLSLALPQLCKCGKCDMSGANLDKVLWKCQKEPNLDDREIADKLNSNEGVCLNYRVNSDGTCDFRKELVDIALSHPIKDICYPSSGYPDICSIHSHRDFNKKCHRAQHYCVYKLQCPTGHYHLPILTALDLPKDDDGECIDKVTITYGSGETISICGSQKELNEFNHKWRRVSYYPLTIKFHTSQCCHNCGFHMWLSCIPDPLLAGQNSGLPYDYNLKDYRNPQKGFMYRQLSGEYQVTIPLGARVTYEDYVITITKGKQQSLYQFADIHSMEVIDDLFGNKTWYGNAEDILFGYGFLLINKDKAMYENLGTPPQLKPSYRELQYITETVQILSPFLVNSTYKTFVEPATKVPLPIIAGKLNRYKPDCQETAEITMGYPAAECEMFEYPSIRSIARSLAEASYLRQSSKNPFVLTIARDVIDLLHKKTSVKSRTEPIA